MTKNINVGGDRWIKFKLDARGNWCGEGYGLRFKLSQIVGRPRHAPRGPRETWHCAVWGQLAGKLLATKLLATCRMHTLKTAVHEGARLADLAANIAPSTDPEPCPT